MIQRPLALASEARWKSSFAAAGNAAGGIVTREINMGECRILLRLAGTALLGSLAASFAPAASEPFSAPPHLTLDLWDEESTGVTIHAGSPPAELPLDGGQAPAEVLPRYNSLTKVTRALSSDRRHGWWTVPAAQNLHYACRIAPLLEFLHTAINQAGMALLHAACVGNPECGVLLAGIGGTGKSTATLACIESGMQIVGEDFTAVSLLSAPTAAAVYTTATITDDTLSWLPAFGSYIANKDRGPGEKYIIYLDQARPRQRLARMPLRAILVMDRSRSGHTEVVPAKRSDALRALCPSTIRILENTLDLQSPAAEMRGHARLASLLPCYRLHAGSSVAGIAAAIQTLLHRL